jgi:quinol monooxygenase YgiN
MVTKGLLVRFNAKHGKDSAVEELLQSAVSLVNAEAGTVAWFAVEFAKHKYGIVDVFANEEDREAHLNGAIAKALFAKADELFDEAPAINKLDVLAYKLPAGPLAEPNTKGLLLTFKPKAEHETEAASFFINAKPLADEEPDTTAWFAIRTQEGEYGIFDTFPDNGGRFKHLIGKIPRELAAHALSLLGSVPDLDLVDVLREKL